MTDPLSCVLAVNIPDQLNDPETGLIIQIIDECEQVTKGLQKTLTVGNLIDLYDNSPNSQDFANPKQSSETIETFRVNALLSEEFPEENKQNVEAVEEECVKIEGFIDTCTQ